MDLSLYEKFPCCFKNALKSGEVAFSCAPQITFKSLDVFRGIFREKGGDFSNITFNDFYSYAELGRKYNPRFGTKDSFYSCSVYKDYKECSTALKFPNPKEDRQISKGPINQNDGCIRERVEDSHVDYWIYEKHSNFWINFKIV